MTTHDIITALRRITPGYPGRPPRPEPSNRPTRPRPSRVVVDTAVLQAAADALEALGAEVEQLRQATPGAELAALRAEAAELRERLGSARVHLAAFVEGQFAARGQTLEARMAAEGLALARREEAVARREKANPPKPGDPSGPDVSPARILQGAQPPAGGLTDALAEVDRLVDG